MTLSLGMAAYPGTLLYLSSIPVWLCGIFTGNTRQSHCHVSALRHRELLLSQLPAAAQGSEMEEAGKLLPQPCYHHEMSQGCETCLSFKSPPPPPAFWAYYLCHKSFLQKMKNVKCFSEKVIDFQ